MKENNRISRKLTSKNKIKVRRFPRALPMAPESNPIGQRARAGAKGHNNKATRTTTAQGKERSIRTATIKLHPPAPRVVAAENNAINNRRQATILKPPLQVLQAVAASHAIKRQATIVKPYLPLLRAAVGGNPISNRRKVETRERRNQDKSHSKLKDNNQARIKLRLREARAAPEGSGKFRSSGF